MNRKSHEPGLIFPTLVLCVIAASAHATDLYVAPNGNDANPGTAEKSFASLENARDTAKSGDRIVLKSGVYRLNETLALGPQHSGVTWMAAPGEAPVISSGVRVTGWTADRNGIFKAKPGRPVKIRQLYVNGKPANLAEGPTVKPLGWRGEFIIKGNEPWATDGAGKAPDGLGVNKADLPALSNPADLELQQQKVWTIQRVGIREIKDGGGEWTLLFDQPAAAIASKLLFRCGLNTGGTRLFNAYEFVDQPGEFYYNSATGWLYYKPREGERMESAEVFVPQLETMVKIIGDNLKNHAEKIRFEGITFAHSAFQMMKIKGCESRGNVCVQSSAMSVMYKNTGNPHVEPWGLYTTMDVAPAAVFVSSAADVVFQRCAFRNLGALALNLENDVVGAEVTGNVFQWVEGTCVNIGHPQHSYIGKQNGDNNGWGPYNFDNQYDKWDETVEGLAKNITVSNNLCRNVCGNLIQMVPIALYAGHSVSILHNDIEGTPYSGITCGWNWGEANGMPDKGISQWAKKGGKPSMSMSGIKINYNRIDRASQTLGDAGHIYFLGDLACQTKNSPVYQRGLAEMIGNYLVAERDHHGADLIGCDQGTSYLRIEGNVLDGRTGVGSVVRRGTGDRCKIFMNNWIGYQKMEDERNFLDKNCFAAMNHFIQRPAGTNVKKEDWPLEAKKIIEKAGLEPEYKKLLK